MNDTLKQQLIQSYLSGDSAIRSLVPSPTGSLGEDLKTWMSEVSPLPHLLEGVEDEEEQQALALVDLHAFSRWRRPSYMEIARSMFVVQPLPQGALPIYMENTDLSEVITGDDSDQD